MEQALCIPAAQYLRMSTEHQQYSIANQQATICGYAERMGFEIVKTYCDAATSGLLFKNRPALRQLLQEVLSGGAPFRAILVYDVSRWGRFQDADEAAHYEFMCKRASIPVHYCAEIFGTDTVSASLMKAVKRVMAAEYSRTLGEKVFAAGKRWAELGFKQGGSAGYALSRAMVSSDGRWKQLLAKGEVKRALSDRVILVPGDREEVACVREMYRLVAQENRSPFAVARELNQRGLTCRGRPWQHENVFRILTDPKYAGCNVWNRKCRRLGGPMLPVPKSKWIIRPGAFEPVVEPSIFEQVQHVLVSRTRAKSNDQILEDLRALLAHHGKLTGDVLNRTPRAPSVATCRRRFGSLHRAFELAGYSVPARYLAKRRRPTSRNEV